VIGNMIHRMLDGSWAKCPLSSTCGLKFHIPDMSVAEVERIPLTLLLPILAVSDPPSTPDIWQPTNLLRDSADWATSVQRMKQASTWLKLDPSPDNPPVLHRDYDLPAVVWRDGTLDWYQEGARHRDHDRPAITLADGSCFWYQHGIPHRGNDQPAVVWADGTLEWYRNGLRHRGGGRPAMTWLDGLSQYWVNGVQRPGSRGRTTRPKQVRLAP
jgi:hypothetical protein